jgi:hypothetical protein
MQCGPQETCRGNGFHDLRGTNRDDVVSMCSGEHILHSVVCGFTPKLSSTASCYCSNAQKE